MSEQPKTSKLGKLNNFVRSNLCNFVKKTQNYEYISYDEDKRPQIKPNNDLLDVCLSQKVQTQSRSRMPIYCKTPEKCLASASIFYQIQGSQHSPNVESILSPSILKLDQNYIENIPSSTLNQLSSTPAFNLPEMSSLTMRNSYESTDETDFSNESITTSSDEYQQHQKDDQIRILACCYSYVAKYEGDMSISFADRVQLIKESNEYCLVKHLETKQFGYVPRACICNVNEFLKNIF